MYYVILPLIGLEFFSNLHWVKLSTSFYFFGVALASFLSSFILHYLNFKRTAYSIIIFFMASSLLTLFSQHLLTIFVGRILSGFALGSIPTLVRSIYHQVKQEKMSLMLMVQNIFTRWVPILSMFIAGYLSLWFDWKAIFVFLLVYVLLLFLWIRKMTFQQITKPKFSILICYKKLLTAPSFLAWIFAYGLLFSCVPIAIFISTFVLHFYWNVNVHLAATLIALAYAGYAIFSMLGVFLIRYLSKHLFLFLGFILMFSSAILMLIASIFLEPSLTAYLLYVALFLAGLSLVAPIYLQRSAELSSNINTPTGFALSTTSAYITSSLVLASLAHFHHQAMVLAIYLLALLSSSLIFGALSFVSLYLSVD
jgi:MFS transporter, DHA1 family, multidrug resistance protein